MSINEVTASWKRYPQRVRARVPLAYWSPAASAASSIYSLVAYPDTSFKPQPSPSAASVFHSEAVTVGLHRVGQTLVLDGNLGDVLVTVNKASAPGSSASAPTPDASSRHRDVDGNNGGAGAAVRDGDGGSGSNKRVGVLIIRATLSCRLPFYNA